MRVPITAVVLLGLAAALPAHLAAESPQAIAPGGTVAFEQVSGRCPTFHWAAVEGAEWLQLVVYGAGETEIATGLGAPLLRVELPGGSQGWTPTLERCLQPGGSYGWSLRARLEDGSESWSEARLFRIAAAPSAVEVEEALDVLRRFQEQEGVQLPGAAAPTPSADTGASRSQEESASERASARDGSRSERRPRESRRRAGRQLYDSPPLSSPSVGAGRPERAPVVPTSVSLSVEADVELGRYVFKGGRPFLHTSPGDSYQNTAVGLYALDTDSTVSTGATAVGYEALRSNTGQEATAVGVRALAQGFGRRNTAVGFEALMGGGYALGGEDNTAVGWYALGRNYAGTRNTAVGANSLNSADYGSDNTAVGFEALRRNFNGYYNTGVGVQALARNFNGSYNTAVGAWALSNADLASTNGSYNTAIGAFALYDSEDGIENTAVGHKALYSNTTIVGPTGTSSGRYNTAVGQEALRDNTIGEKNTALGQDAMRNNTTGVANTAVGENALVFSVTGDRNTAVGQDALRYSDGAEDNTAVGENALRDATTADGNTAVGRSAGSNITTGGGNILIGESAGVNVQTGFDNILIGSFGGLSTAESQIIRIGDPNRHNRTHIAGIRGVFTAQTDSLPVLIDSDGQLGTENSSRRFKTDVRELDAVSSAIRRLRPVSFRYKGRGATGEALQLGLIAEEVAEVLPDLVYFDESGRPEGVLYRYLTPILIKEVQTQQRQIHVLQGAIALLVLASVAGWGRRRLRAG